MAFELMQEKPRVRVGLASRHEPMHPILQVMINGLHDLAQAWIAEHSMRVVVETCLLLVLCSCSDFANGRKLCNDRIHAVIGVPNE